MLTAKLNRSGIDEPAEKPTRSEIAKMYGLVESDLDELELSGVKLPEEPVQIGEGLTRSVYHGVYKRGERKMELAVKIPKPVKPEDSIIGYINTTRRDVNRREVEIHNALEGHHRIVPVLGTIETEDGRTVSFEQLKGKAMNLEEFVKRCGPIFSFTDKDRSVKFIENLIEPFLYLNRPEVRVLHRDVKPSNILMSSDGPLLTDFQNATLNSWSCDCSAQPTRGGTAYTRYTLINRLLRGEETTYTSRDEMHSIAATILYALTGEDPFDYKLRGVAVEDDYEPAEKETVVKVDGKKFLIKLSSGEKDLEEITEEENTRRVRSAISKMDGTLRKKYGSLLERCLIPGHKRPVRDVEHFQREFEEINSSFYLRAKEKLIAGARLVLPTVGAVAVGALVLGGLSYLGDAQRDSPPSVMEMLRAQDYARYNLSDLDKNARQMAYPILVPYMKQAEKVLPEMEKDHNMKKWEIGETSRFANDIHRLPRRLVSAWLRACMMNKDLVGQYGEGFDEKRLGPSFVPRSFMIKNSTLLGYRPCDEEDQRIVNAQGIMYLKFCLGPNQTVEDTYSEYFSSRLDQSTSMARTGSGCYLPREVDGKIKVGYHSHLPPYQRQLISSAVALYMITDNEGEIHYDWIPEITPNHVPVARGFERCIISKDIEDKRAEFEIAKKNSEKARRGYFQGMPVETVTR